ncbi:MAG: hypothetical protein H6709_22290 [Kofleriaceae bacterium]|nr:hypothetical protein [Myxococcales bacterium]MCB9564379.1 hypothetical protein [Kofleriaceae bacterium]MCB9574811.1 hypothetical protein [Kofleriaceae bacterium]
MTPQHLAPRLRLVALGLGVLGAGCGGKSRGAAHAQPMPVPSIGVGECGQPESAGVLGDHPDLVHADRDLDGDGQPEVVVADRSMCSPEGNCYWNVFVRPPAGAADTCQRFAGTLAGTALEPTGGTGEDRYADLRGYWKLTGGGRVLLQEYRFRRGGYQVVDAIICRREGDDRLLCAEADDGAEPDAALGGAP